MTYKEIIQSELGAAIANARDVPLTIRTTIPVILRQLSEETCKSLCTEMIGAGERIKARADEAALANAST